MYIYISYCIYPPDYIYIHLISFLYFCVLGIRSYVLAPRVQLCRWLLRHDVRCTGEWTCQTGAGDCVGQRKYSSHGWAYGAADSPPGELWLSVGLPTHLQPRVQSMRVGVWYEQELYAHPTRTGHFRERNCEVVCTCNVGEHLQHVRACYLWACIGNLMIDYYK